MQTSFAQHCVVSKCPETKCRNQPFKLPVSEHRRVPNFILGLKECTKARDLELGRKLHQEAIATGCHTNKYVATALVTMYSGCGEIQEAEKLFHKMPAKGIVTWTSMILGYVENGQSPTALKLFSHIECEPDNVAFVAALKACACMAAAEGSTQREACLNHGRDIHRRILLHGFHSNLVVATTLLDMYSKCGSMDSAREVFNSMKERTIVSWNCLLLGYVENGQAWKALQLYKTLECTPNHVTFIAGLKISATLAVEPESDKEMCLHLGMNIHQQLKDARMDSDNLVVECTLVDMYRKCGRIDLAREVFNRMSQRNVVAWTNLIMGYVQNGECYIALKLFNSMDCQPDYVTYIAALKACSGLARNEAEKHLSLQQGIVIHEQVRDRGLESKLAVANAVVEMYCKCGKVFLAREVFDRLPHRDVITWNCMTMGYIENGENINAIELFTKMDFQPDSFTFVSVLKACASLAGKNQTYRKFCLEKGRAIHDQVKALGCDSNILVMNTLLDTYSNCGEMILARAVFDSLQTRDVVTWNCLILGYLDNNEPVTALELFASMDCQQNRVTLIAALKACSSLAWLPSGRVIHGEIYKLGLEQDEMVSTSLVDFYGKFGGITVAELVFGAMHTPNLATWNVLLAGYGYLGDVSQAELSTRKLQEAGLKVDEITFLSLLTACSRAGNVEQGKRIFDSMERYGVSPGVDHYTCIVDMLGKANRVQEALSLVNSMPHEGDSVLWTTLLGECRKWNNLEVGKLAFNAAITSTTRR